MSKILIFIKYVGIQYIHKKWKTKKKTKSVSKCECLKMSCKTITSYFCCQEKNDDNKKKFHCCCCCNFKEIDKDDYSMPNNYTFTYCYKGKRKHDWCFDFFINQTQREFICLMLNYIYLQFISIGFEKIYNDNNDNMNIDDLLSIKRIIISSISYLIIILVYFYITISWAKYTNESGTDNNNQKILKVIQEHSKEILRGTSSILPFNSICSLIFSIFYFSGNSKLKDAVTENNHLISILIVMNKFYYFIFSYYCVNISLDRKGFEIISGSTIISLYLLAWNFVYNFIIINLISVNVLIIIQFIPSIIVFFILVIMIGYHMCFEGKFWRTLIYLLFFFVGGGIWFFECFKDDERFDCCCKECDCCNNKECLDNCLKKLNDTKCIKKLKNCNCFCFKNGIKNQNNYEVF